MAFIFFPLSACMVGPNYKRPAAITAPSFKEATPASFATNDGWKPGQPGDTGLKGDWWTLFHDAQLNELEAKVDSANQTLKAAEANFRAARAQIGYARSNEAPTIGVEPSLSAVRDSANEPYFPTTLANNGEGNFNLPVDLNYEIDLWGRIRREVTSARALAQAGDADLESAGLSLPAELAIDYFGLRAADAQEKLLDDTVKAYESAVQLTQDRFEGGAAPQSDLAEARTQLDQARVQRTDIEVRRTQFEHAIAVLIGKPPAQFALTRLPLDQASQVMPDVPGTLPATLLERRPDIAGDERRMASANEQIGIAEVAFFCPLSLSAIAGFQG